MSDRASIRGHGPRGRGSNRGDRGDHHNRPGARGGHTNNAATSSTERPKKENILDLSKYADKSIIVKFSGGREVSGVLKGWDQLMNLVLDGVEEVLRDDEGNSSTRPLGLLVARGTLLTSISPSDGSEVIDNPFAADAEEEVTLEG